MGSDISARTLWVFFHSTAAAGTWTEMLNSGPVSITASHAAFHSSATDCDTLLSENCLNAANHSDTQCAYRVIFGIRVE